MTVPPSHNLGKESKGRNDGRVVALVALAALAVALFLSCQNMRKQSGKASPSTDARPANSKDTSRALSADGEEMSATTVVPTIEKEDLAKQQSKQKETIEPKSDTNANIEEKSPSSVNNTTKTTEDAATQSRDKRDKTNPTGPGDSNSSSHSEISENTVQAIAKGRSHLAKATTSASLGFRSKAREEALAGWRTVAPFARTNDNCKQLAQQFIDLLQEIDRSDHRSEREPDMSKPIVIH